MIFSTFAFDYFRWHYSTALRELFLVWSNLMWFMVYFFSLPQLVASWFAPWKRMTEQRSRAWNFEDMLGTFFINLMSRIVGGLIRSVFIFIGMLALCSMTLLGIIAYIIWITAPAFILALCGLGIGLIISSLTL